jgi:hypothetical protein
MTCRLTFCMSTFWLNSGGNLVARKSFWSTVVAILQARRSRGSFSHCWRGLGVRRIRNTRLRSRTQVTSLIERGAHGPLAHQNSAGRPVINLPYFCELCQGGPSGALFKLITNVSIPRVPKVYILSGRLSTARRSIINTTAYLVQPSHTLLTGSSSEQPFTLLSGHWDFPRNEEDLTHPDVTGQTINCSTVPIHHV